MTTLCALEEVKRLLVEPRLEIYISLIPRFSPCTNCKRQKAGWDLRMRLHIYIELYIWCLSDVQFQVCTKFFVLLGRSYSPVLSDSPIHFLHEKNPPLQDQIHKHRDHRSLVKSNPLSRLTISDRHDVCREQKKVCLSLSVAFVYLTPERLSSR